jgi:hypothetical protein
MTLVFYSNAGTRILQDLSGHAAFRLTPIHTLQPTFNSLRGTVDIYVDGATADVEVEVGFVSMFKQ